MARLDASKRVVRESSELSKKGEDRKALKLLDDSIADAILQNDTRRIRVLTRHAAVISEHIGDLNLARQYIEQSLQHSSDDPVAWYSLADTLSRQGGDKLARQYAAKAYNLSLKRGLEGDKHLIETLKKRWPEICPKDR